MDKPDHVLSLINLTTLRASRSNGAGPRSASFRANFYIDGAQPWGEFDWVGAATSSSATSLSGSIAAMAAAGRPTSTPPTGLRDLDVAGALRASFGHKDLGIYLGDARKTGEVTIGATVQPPHGARANWVAPLGVHAANGHRRFICRGCYFIYSEEAGLPAEGIAPGTTCQQLPDNWRCPDCGTDKGKLRPYVA